jgi:hypothetical protein
MFTGMQSLMGELCEDVRPSDNKMEICVSINSGGSFLVIVGNVADNMTE